MTAAVLVADCVSKSFGARRVLSAGSLRAQPGQVRVLFGRNGIGKSTLLKIAAGVIVADSGTVHINGRALLRPSLSQLAMAGVFYLPDHELLSPAFTLGQQLRFFEQRFGTRSAREVRAWRASRTISPSDLRSYREANSGGRNLPSPSHGSRAACSRTSHSEASRPSTTTS